MNTLRYILFIAGLLIFGNMFSVNYSPDDLINPNIQDRSRYVSDPEGRLSVQARKQADDILWNLRQKTGAEVAVVVVPNIGDYPIEDFSTKLFTKWGIGKSDKDNGVLVLIVPDQRMARIATGYGVEGIIPDISARKIIDRSIVPYMRQNDLDGAVVAVSSDIANILSDPVAAEELKSSEAESWNKIDSDITGEDIIIFLIWTALFVFIASLILYVSDSKRFNKLDRYRQALEWYKERRWFIVLAILSCGLGLITFFLVERKYRNARNKPLNCPACKGKMRKLNEEEDNNLLSPSQDFEEKINSVDYDVWVCEECGTVERYPFRNLHTKYEECPNCHTVAMSLIRDHTLQPATTRSLGLGERVYECKYCHNQTKKRYSIPKKENIGAPLVAGSILGSGRGGGGFGGGFGGGMTGGGGATGRW